MNKLVTLYKCLCDETRLRILHLLQHSPLCVCHVQEILGISQVNATRHLAYLKKNGMIRSTRHQNWTLHALPDTISSELDVNLRCLQDLANEMPVFRKDRKALDALLRRQRLRADGCPLPQLHLNEKNLK